MAKGRRKKTVSSRPSEAPAVSDGAAVVSGRGWEALGLALLLMAVGLCFALFSFEPGDRSGDANLVGPLGVGLANLILGGIGVVGYVVALAGVVAAGAILLGRLRIPSFVGLLSGGSLALGATVLAHLVAGGQGLLGHPAGGMAGMVTAEAIRSVAGPAGAALAAVGLVLLGVLGLSRWSLADALQDGARFAKLGLDGFGGHLSMWRAARQAARQREEELVEAARSRRAQAQLEAEARERALEEALDEKKRLALLKATAKAEQKALEKIAAQEAKARVAAELEAGTEEREDDEAETEPFEAVSHPPVDEVDETDEAVLSDAPIISLGIPGPAAEPDVIISDQEPLDDAAEVLASFAKTAPSAPPESADDAIEAEVAVAPARPKRAPKEKAETDTDELVIHERKQVEADFEDEGKAKVPAKERPTYELPAINLLDYEGDAPEQIDGELLKRKATRLEEKLRTYGVEGKVTAIRPGPVVTTYEYQPAPGVKVSKIANLSDDIAMSMEAVRVRIVAPIPGRGVVGIELPNDSRETVYLKELIAHDHFKKSSSLLTLAMGKDAEGDVQVRNLQKMPHLLIAGTTGSGKSVAINTMILSILYKATPEQVKFIMVDPKMLELSLYNDIPHLLLPVVTDPKKASMALQWAVDEMERRYQMLSDMKVRDIGGFNKKLKKLADQRSRNAELAALGGESLEEGAEMEAGSERPAVSEPPEAVSEKPGEKALKDPWAGQDLPEELPYIVVLIDEFADLMCVAPRDVEASVQRLAQKARAAGIHVLLATQRPSTDVITGVIKNNFPARVAFRVASRHDSATILNSPGAENLLGMGDSLFLSVASPSAERIHGAFVSEDEVERVVDFWKAQAKPKYDESILKPKEEDADSISDEDRDEHYDTAVKIVTETKRASISALQRRLRVGYNRAARMIEMMEVEGIVSPASGPKGEREVLVNAMGPDGPPRV